MEGKIREFLVENMDPKWIPDITLAPIPKGKSGDIAMAFFIVAKKTGKSPNSIAKTVSEKINSAPFLEKSEIVGPYLNLFIKPNDACIAAIETPLENEEKKGKTIVVEYSSPNTNKPLHLGHMRNHALGISFSRILETTGAKVVRTSVINDRGIHICKSMLAYEKWGNGKTPENTGEKSDTFVGRFYVRFETESKKNSALKEEAQTMLQQWEAGDDKIKALWKQMNNWALQGHEKTYKRQDVVFDKKYYESETYTLGKKFAEKGLKDGIFYEKDGAVWLDLSAEKLDQKIIIRSDGTTVYITQDLATTFLRYEDFHFDEHIWVVADEQNYHFKVLITALQKLHLVSSEKLFHLAYGLVNLPDGRMKSREGNVVDADNLMDELSQEASKKIKENHPDWDEEKIKKTAEMVQDAAWKFFLLKPTPVKTMIFDAEKSIDFLGATGPYVQYAIVRIKSLLEKAQEEKIDWKSQKNFSKAGKNEKVLAIKILEWPEVLRRSVNEKNPGFISTYVMELAQSWSKFYAENQILKAPEETKKIRLKIAEKTQEVLEKALFLLGISVPEKM